MFKKSFTVAAVTLACSFGVAQAATVDLSIFAVNNGINGSASVSPNFASMTGTSSISGNVLGATSFDWFFQAGDYVPYNDYSFFISTSTGTVTLSDVATVGNYGNSGWQTYNFASAYTGSLTFGVANLLDNGLNSTLSVTNVSVSAVPEAETYAMLLAGLGVIGTIARRRKQALAA